MKNEKIKPSSAQSFKRFDKLDFCRKKINTFQEMITNTILAVQQYKVKDIRIDNYKIIIDSYKRLKIQYSINNKLYVMNSYIPFYGKTSKNFLQLKL